MEIIGAYKSCLVKKSNNSFLSKGKKTDNEKQNKKTFLDVLLVYLNLKKMTSGIFKIEQN